MVLKIADRIKLLREENGLSQAELAHALGVSRMTINNYETGKRSPDIDFTIKLADYFFVTVEYLIGKSEFKKQDDKNYTNEKVEQLMAVAENLPQPKLQGFLKNLRVLLENTGDNEVGEEILYILLNTVTSCNTLLSEYKQTSAAVSEKTAYLKEKTALTDDQILSLIEPHFDALYKAGYKFLDTTSETVKSAILGMQERTKRKYMQTT